MLRLQCDHTPLSHISNFPAFTSTKFARTHAHLHTYEVLCEFPLNFFAHAYPRVSNAAEEHGRNMAQRRRDIAAAQGSGQLPRVCKYFAISLARVHGDNLQDLMWTK